MAKDTTSVRSGGSLLGDQDLYLFNEGTHLRLYDKLGSHLTEVDGDPGVHFAVWAPNATRVAVVGDFNGWDGRSHPLAPRGDSGIWEGFIPQVEAGTTYKYRITRQDGTDKDKYDPYAAHTETPPKTGSKVWDLSFDWDDDDWMASRGERQTQESAIAIYEVHMGSWQRGDGDRLLTYRELAPRLAEHVANMGFTHVEFLPIMEFPFEGSWGYQTTGYFAPSSRYGTPQDFMFLVDTLHRAGIGVILDWVPSHFPTDDFALQEFDGTHLYEHADQRKGFHPDWKSSIFNYGRHEVRSFLLSSAVSWLDRYHVDGLRVDAVASMLYLDYSREDGEWIPNEYGGNENIEAVEFLRQLNTQVYGEFPDVQTFAEESTAWPGVSRPTYLGGLGFGFKWDMGWMHDTLDYFQRDPVHRRFHHDRLTFRAIYAWAENYCLPLSHDEVVHGKGSLLDKMPGDDWQQFANLRCLLAWQFATPGKKLLFQGQEFGQRGEWKHAHSLDWHELESPMHGGVLRMTRDAAHAYRETPALHVGDVHPHGFRWVDASDTDQSVLSMLRQAAGHPPVLVVANFTPVPRHGYRVGVPMTGSWSELLNTDAQDYGGSGQGNLGAVEADEEPMHGFSQSVSLTLPPLSVLFLRAPGAE